MISASLNLTFLTEFSVGSHILNLTDLPKDKIYSHKLKGISLCFTLLKQALCGNYVNFGVFRLYNDPTLDDVFNMFMKLVMSIPKNNILVCA